MEDNLSRQEEARRVLEAIKQNAPEAEPASAPPVVDPKPKPGARPFSTVGGETANQLQALVSISLGIKDQPLPDTEEPLPDPGLIDPISTEQIKVMRKVAATTGVGQSSLQNSIYHAIIKAYFSVVDRFKPSTRAQQCITAGHQCLHCGKIIQETLATLAKDKKESTAPGELNGK